MNVRHPAALLLNAFMLALVAMLGSNPATPAPVSVSAESLQAQMQETVNATLGGMVAAHRSSFAGAVFIDKGQLAFASQFGVEGPDRTQPFSVDSTYVDLNSVVKLFIAISIARLIEEGAIGSVDDPVNRYLKHYKLPPAFGHDVTIRELATHSAGLDATDLGPGKLRTDPTRFLTEYFPGYVKNPDRYSAYDNYGPQLLAYLVSEVTGKPFSHYVNDSILHPLHMDHTYLTEPPVPLTHRVIPFQPKAPADTKPAPLMPDAPAQLVGASVATLSDMAILVGALLGPAPDQGVVTPRMRSLMFGILQSNGPRGSAHGLMFDIVRSGARTLVVHGGVGPGERCLMALDTDRGAGLFYCYGDVRPRLDLDPTAVPPSFEEVTNVLLKPLTSCTIEPAVPCVRYTPAGWSDRWNRYVGLYVNSARHHHGFSKLRTLIHPTALTVKRVGDSLSLDGQVGFFEIAPGTFGRPGYLEMFSFIEDPATHAITLSVSDRPSVYERPTLLEDPRLLPGVLAMLVLIALSGGLIAVWPAYGRQTSLRFAVALYVFVIGAGVAALFGLRAFGTPYFEGTTWPLEIVRVFAFLTIPACVNLVMVSMRLHRSGQESRPGWWLRCYVHVIAASSVLLVAVLLIVQLISFSRIT